MDIFTVRDLQTLIDTQSSSCLSLYMPVHSHGRDAEQDPIRFRNLLREAEARLLAGGLRTPAVRSILAPAEALLQDSLFWSRGGVGLALFSAEGFFRTYRLALQFPELLTVASRFHVKPVMSTLATDGRYYILALSQKEVRLLEASRHTVDVIDTERTLPALAEALQYERYERQSGVHTTTSMGPGQSQTSYHASDITAGAKERIVRWFRKIDAELAALRKGQEYPLVLAGVEYLFPLYREANTYARLVEGGVPGNPEELSAEELHAGAWPLVEPLFDAGREAAVHRYARLAGTGRTTADPAEAVVAAGHGRMDTLFVALDAQVWGRYDPATDSVNLHDDRAPSDGDLLDQAALLTLENSGTVYAVPSEQIPGGGVLAAVFRY
jgi:hypothetical protein